jgi:hypothetical protein
MVRDIWRSDGKLFTCAYATLNEDFQLVWRYCPEGVEFSKIHPLIPGVLANAD